MRTPLSWLALCLAFTSPALANPVGEIETLDLIPEHAPGFTLTTLFAPVTGWFFGGPGYWYAAREVAIKTTPPGAVLDLFYVRRGFQLLYEHGEAPARVRLPRRVDTTTRDFLIVRASLAGHQPVETRVAVRSRDSELAVTLARLPNTLQAFSQLEIAGGLALTFVATDDPSFRVQRDDHELRILFIGTSAGPVAVSSMAATQSGSIAQITPLQLGEDLVVRIAWVDAKHQEMEARAKKFMDPVRDLHRLTIEILPPGDGSNIQEHARTALDSLTTTDIEGCALRFDERLRGNLDAAALSRALAPRGTFVDPILHAALRRLGEVSPQRHIRMLDGSTLDPMIPIEHMAASTQPREAIGYLALLRNFSKRVSHTPAHVTTLRALVAPELEPARFTRALEDALAAEATCRARDRIGSAQPNEARQGRRGAPESRLLAAREQGAARRYRGSKRTLTGDPVHNHAREHPKRESRQVRGGLARASERLGLPIGACRVAAERSCLSLGEEPPRL